MMRLPEYSLPPASYPGLPSAVDFPRARGLAPGLHATAASTRACPPPSTSPGLADSPLGYMLPPASARACLPPSTSPRLADSPWATCYRPRVPGLALQLAIEQSCGYISWRKNELSEVLNRNTTREPFLSLLRQTNRQFLCAHRNTIRQFIK